MLPALRAASASHPRLHSVWPSLLAFLLPGFKVDRVSYIVLQLHLRIGGMLNSPLLADTAGSALPFTMHTRCLKSVWALD